MSQSIGEFKDRHKDKRLFILASGPSLADCDLSLLRNRIVMTLNRSILTYPEPYYHCVMDQRLFDMYPEEFKKARCLFTLEGRPFGVQMKNLAADGFSWDLEQGVHTGYTISYVALQLAVYMGFAEAYFVGLDLRHREGRTHFFGKDSVSENHENTEFPKMLKMLKHAAVLLRSKPIQVYNCSPISTLDAFPFLSFEEAVKR